MHDFPVAGGFLAGRGDFAHRQDLVRLDLRLDFAVHHVNEVIEFSSIAVHETAGERVPDRWCDDPV